MVDDLAALALLGTGASSGQIQLSRRSWRIIEGTRIGGLLGLKGVQLDEL